ncbi:branched-chain amino acid ABC transporter permease [Rhizobiaceae bacterium]|nr:branched-chain amino acid ABC transporter permease [Rhizobiaceae bacterium]
MTGARVWLTALFGALIVIAVGFVMPAWLLFTVTKAIAFGLVALGIVALMRGGLVSFGQGAYYCVGAYASGLAAAWYGITDAIAMLLIGGVAGGLVAALVAPLVARYRGIFFAMLTMALSMVLYGMLAKITVIGASDGFNVPRPTFLGYAPIAANVDITLFIVAVIVAAICAALARLYFDSGPGMVALASRENELRIEYLGASVFSVTARNFIVAGTLAGLGGTLNALALKHVDPFFSFWTTSGEFVFVAILGGYASAIAVFGAALITELVRSYSSTYFPDSWQLALGLFLLLIIIFLPKGFGSLWTRQRVTDVTPEQEAVEAKPVVRP